MKAFKKTWLISNALFVLNYSLYLSLFIVRLPIPNLPSIFNIIFLLLSYSTSLLKMINKISTIPAQPNFYCILVFLTFPSPILLLPFYFLSLYHLISFVLSHKVEFEHSGIYRLCVVLSSWHVALGRMALVCKIVGVPLSLILFVFGSGSIGTFLTYIWMVRQEYQNIPAMRSVFGEVRCRMDEAVGMLPENVQYFYLKTKELIMHYQQVMK
ncbi:hypothetical protein NGRA_1573 [Nosema granulosis]|uniref:Uncharacterized protein n=1 Tax=Nosema granulosis TaxID=83296 RepID=A0A9P6KZ82_9MICR|nr:hypothetical protein NGRA_1573 [Nosema granulosis]